VAGFLKQPLHAVTKLRSCGTDAIKIGGPLLGRTLAGLFSYGGG
jgi:hypothetical protein